MPYICSMMGASLVIVAESKTRGRKATSTPVISEVPSDVPSDEVDYVIVTDETTKAKIGKDIIAKTCNVEWVKQCLVSAGIVCSVCKALIVLPRNRSWVNYTPPRL
jgi:hypothetical protein